MGLPTLNKSDFRFMLWLAHFTSSWGAELGRVSTVVGRLERWGMIERDGKRVILTGSGWQALIEHGYEPRGLDGRTLEELIQRPVIKMDGR